jgi:hypothetical protein
MRIEHTEGCVTVNVSAEHGTNFGKPVYDIEVRAQDSSGEPQHLRLTTDIAVNRLIVALTKMVAARGALTT